MHGEKRCRPHVMAKGRKPLRRRIGTGLRPGDENPRHQPSNSARRAGLARDRRSRPNAMACAAASSAERSEEHTSELQSLMRISYAVFCLKKKKESGNTQKL